MPEYDAIFYLFSPIALLLGFFLGAIVGSFFATILVRWPRGESVSHGRSHCDGCGRQLAWFDLVPLVSHLALRGRCRKCRATIDPLHFWVELAFALATAVLFTLDVPLWAPFAWLLITMAVFDAMHLWLPDRLTLAFAVLAIALPPLDAQFGILARILTGAGTYALMMLVAAAFRYRTGRDGMGGGDPKLLGALAIWAGPVEIPLLLLVACAIGLADAALRIASGRADRRVQLPLGTYLALAGLGFMVLAPGLQVMA